MKKCSIKVYSKEDLVSSPKKIMLGGLCWNVNPRKLLEKSGTKYQGVLVLIPSDQQV
jgi:hypothetical protein